MKVTTLLSTTMILFACLACAMAPEVKPLPSWCEQAGLSQGRNQVVYFGRADDASTSADALKLATGRALTQLTSELGVTTSSESMVRQSEQNGVLNTEVQATVKTASKTFEIRGMKRVKAESVERDGGHTGCVAIQITPDEKGRLERLARNRSALTLYCKTQSLGDAECPSDPTNRLNSVLTSRGAQLLPVTETGKLSNRFLASALEAEAASAFEAVIESRLLEVINGEHYAEASLTLKHIDTADQKSILTLQVPAQKGGHYSDRDAELAAIEAALAALEEALQDHSF